MTIDDEIKILYQKALPANNNKKRVKKTLIFISISLCFLIGIASLYTYNTQPIDQNVNINVISITQANNIKNLVKAVSVKTNTHVNTIHSNLKDIFHYKSYLTIDENTYQQVIKHLKSQL